MPLKNNLRVILWVLFGIALIVNVQLFTREFPAPPRTLALSAPAPAAPSLGSTAPIMGATADSTVAAGGVSAPAQAGLSAEVTSGTSAPTVQIRTDVLDLTVSLQGGNLVGAQLLAYPAAKNQPDHPVELLQDSPPVFELQGGLAGMAGGQSGPTHLTRYTSSVTSATLAAGQNQVSVPLMWTDGEGLTVVKTLTLHRNSYAIDVDYQISNAGSTPFAFAPYDQIVRLNEPLHRSYFNPSSYAYKGPAYFDGARFEKLNYLKGEKLDASVRGGYLAALQPYFFAAILPPQDAAFQYTSQSQDQEFLLKVVGQMQTVAPGAMATVHDTLYVGPKQQSRLDAVHPALDRVADYGRLTVLAKPLFWLLEGVHRVIGNWGFAIIIATLLIKLVLYPLSETSYRSMARMKALSPRLNALRETYKDDREKLARAQMELYKKEKINPVAGCLPMLVQVPVFFAWYWVLRDSVEMRQAPFILWINDLSARDPWFVLPAAMAVAMFIQTKYFAAPASDPAQQRVMMFMPLAMSATFAFFPAGLVLYYITNTVLGILQQWSINRRVEAAQARATR